MGLSADDVILSYQIIVNLQIGPEQIIVLSV